MTSIKLGQWKPFPMAQLALRSNASSFSWVHCGRTAPGGKPWICARSDEVRVLQWLPFQARFLVSYESTGKRRSSFFHLATVSGSALVGSSGWRNSLVKGYMAPTPPSTTTCSGRFPDH